MEENDSYNSIIIREGIQFKNEQKFSIDISPKISR